MHYIIKIILITILTINTLGSYIANGQERSTLLSIGTNIIYDIMLMPNIEIEFYPTKQLYTLQAEVTAPWYKKSSKHQYFQMQRYMFHIKFYPLAKESHEGIYISPYIDGGIYDFEERVGWFKIHNLNYRGYRGEFIGSGITFGYTFRLKSNPRLKFDFKLALGYIHTRYKKYIAVDNRYPFVGHYKRNIFVPTEIGVVIKYETIMRKKDR